MSEEKQFELHDLLKQRLKYAAVMGCILSWSSKINLQAAPTAFQGNYKVQVSTKPCLWSSSLEPGKTWKITPTTDWDSTKSFLKATPNAPNGGPGLLAKRASPNL